MFVHLVSRIVLGYFMARGATTVPNELQEGLRKHEQAYLSSKVDAMMARYGMYINRYCGGVPPRLVAARIFLETGGSPTATAKSLKWYCGIQGSEIGLLQINPCNRKTYGLTDAQAKDPEINIKYGCKIWNDWANVFFGEMPGVTDRAVWLWLVTSVGPGAARKLRSMAGGYSISSLMSVAGNASLMEAARSHFGSQSAALVAWRVGTAINAARASGSLGEGGVIGIALGLAAGYYGFKYLMRG